MSVQNEFLFQGELLAEHIDGLMGPQEVLNSSIVLVDKKKYARYCSCVKIGGN